MRLVFDQHSGVRLLSLPMSRLSPDARRTTVGYKRVQDCAQGKDRKGQTGCTHKQFCHPTFSSPDFRLAQEDVQSQVTNDRK